MWSADSLKTKVSLSGHKCGVAACDFSPDGKLLAAVGRHERQSIVLWNWRKEEEVLSVSGHQEWIRTIKFNPYNDTELVTLGTGHIKFWSLTGEIKTLSSSYDFLKSARSPTFHGTG